MVERQTTKQTRAEEPQAGQVKRALRTLQSLHNKKGFLLMYDHEAKREGRPRRDISSVLEGLPEEAAEEVWAKLEERGLSINGIDGAPKGKKSKQKLKSKVPEDLDAFMEDQSLHRLINQHSQEEILTQKEEIGLFIKRNRASRNGNKEEKEAAEHELVQRNLRLVLSVAEKYQRQGADIDDLFQGGNIGLMRAIDKFDWKRGFKLSTYAVRWIKQGVIKTRNQTTATITLPDNFREKLGNLTRTRSYLTQEMGIENPTDEDIADLMGKTRGEVRDIKENWRVTDSLEEEIGKDKDMTLGKTVVDPNPGPEELFELKDSKREFSSRVKELFSVLTPREKEALTIRYLSDPDKVLSLSEVGNHFRVSKQRIQQLERNAQSKMIKYLIHDKKVRSKDVLNYLFGEQG